MNRETLTEYFYYDGHNLRYKKHRHGLPKDCVGEIAGYIDSKGYRMLTFRQKKYKAHRLIWLLHSGDWPKDCIDHINGDKLDNRIENLRDCDHTTNMRNLRNVGVTRSRGKFLARLGQRYLGHFDTYDEARLARNSAEQEHWS